MSNHGSNDNVWAHIDTARDSKASQSNNILLQTSSGFFKISQAIIQFLRNSFSNRNRFVSTLKAVTSSERPNVLQLDVLRIYHTWNLFHRIRKDLISTYPCIIAIALPMRSVGFPLEFCISDWRSHEYKKCYFHGSECSFIATFDGGVKRVLFRRMNQTEIGFIPLIRKKVGHFPRKWPIVLYTSEINFFDGEKFSEKKISPFFLVERP